jgi:hypothetical protein
LEPPRKVRGIDVSDTMSMVSHISPDKAIQKYAEKHPYNQLEKTIQDASKLLLV